MEYLARSVKSFHSAVAGLRAVGQGALVPHVDGVLVDIVAQGARRKIMVEFDRIFVGDGFTEAEMTWTHFQLYFIKAGHLADTKLPRTKAAAKETDDTKKKGGKGGKGGKGDTPKGAQAPGAPRADQGLPSQPRSWR